MEILASAGDWIQTDAENLARFLESDTGKRLLPKLAEHCPVLLDKGHINTILIRSGEVRAWTGMIEALLYLAHPAPETATTNATEYPPLTDDTAWNDGQKLVETQTENPVAL